jgi:hypothetical protein
MKYLLFLALLFGFVGSAYQAIWAESIRDRHLRITEKRFGRDSWVFQSSHSIMNSRFYVLNWRVAGGIVALLFLAAFVYAVILSLHG